MIDSNSDGNEVEEKEEVESGRKTIGRKGKSKWSNVILDFFFFFLQ